MKYVAVVVISMLLFVVSPVNAYACSPDQYSLLEVVIEPLDGSGNPSYEYDILYFKEGNEGWITAEIHQDYKDRYPNYNDFAFLQEDERVSYRARFYEEPRVFYSPEGVRFLDLEGTSISIFQLIVFSADGTILYESSELHMSDFGPQTNEGEFSSVGLLFNENTMELETITMGNGCSGFPGNIIALQLQIMLFGSVALVVGLGITVWIIRSKQNK